MPSDLDRKLKKAKSVAFVCPGELLEGGAYAKEIQKHDMVFSVNNMGVVPGAADIIGGRIDGLFISPIPAFNGLVKKHTLAAFSGQYLLQSHARNGGMKIVKAFAEANDKEAMDKCPDSWRNAAKRVGYRRPTTGMYGVQYIYDRCPGQIHVYGMYSPQKDKGHFKEYNTGKKTAQRPLKHKRHDFNKEAQALRNWPVLDPRVYLHAGTGGAYAETLHEKVKASTQPMTKSLKDTSQKEAYKNMQAELRNSSSIALVCPGPEIENADIVKEIQSHDMVFGVNNMLHSAEVWESIGNRLDGVFFRNTSTMGATSATVWNKFIGRYALMSHSNHRKNKYRSTEKIVRGGKWPVPRCSISRVKASELINGRAQTTGMYAIMYLLEHYAGDVHVYGLYNPQRGEKPVISGYGPVAQRPQVHRKHDFEGESRAIAQLAEKVNRLHLSKDTASFHIK